jgi:tRNASer (uridine44-2'-O)-methyltransferase
MEDIRQAVPISDLHRDTNTPPKNGNKDEKNDASDPGYKFEPVDLTDAPLVDSGLPSEIWTIVQSAPANFTPQYFLEVSRNLLDNPNLTATYLSRAELSYTSFTDATYNPEARTPHELASIVKHMKADHQPRLVLDLPGYKLDWTVVRKLIPRNPKLDESLVQTCHMFTSTGEVAVREKDGSSRLIETERYLVIYLPHVSDPESIPFYHPKVRGVAILYTFQTNAPPGTAPGTLSLHYDLFPERPLDNRMSRTALKMIEIIHKHSKGRMKGYQKRVHHDVVIPQKTFQDTYAYLKGKYAQRLIAKWVEQTPPEKHVFEDLGIAAFLIELWADMYGGELENVQSLPDLSSATANETSMLEAGKERKEKAQRSFPGFVDIGCGNGLLVYILNKEGWNGWGFDARRRKTWDTFEEQYQNNLKEMLLVPKILQSKTENEDSVADAPISHNGLFPLGTFIVSNHADELTPWTPLLAFLSESPFIAIPCCSHSLSGTRFRAPYYRKHFPTSTSPSKQPSAFTSLCSYVAYLTSTMSYIPETEYLRIPSTRNIALIGRKREGENEKMKDLEEKMKLVQEVVEKEMGGDTSIEQVGMQWFKNGSGLMKPGNGGH